MTFYGNDNYDLLWSGVSGEHEAVQKQASFVHAKVAVSQYWPFLSRAVDEKDFENRLELTLDRIAAVVPADSLEDVLSSFRDDYKAVTAKGENPFAKDDDEDNDEADDDDKDSKKSKSDDSDDDSDDDDSDDKSDKDSDDDSDDSNDDDDKPDFLKGKESSRKTAGKCYNCDSNTSHPGQELCDECQANEDFVQRNPYANDPYHVPYPAKGPARGKQATNYQPDPNAAWRYHPEYAQLRQPVDNGALQDSDGFVKDLAEGEGRSNPVMEQRQLTPGVWTEHDGMPERPMPFSQQNRGYMPVNASFDKEGYVVAEKNVWGTEKSEINADEYCPDCEHAVPGHYTNCLQHVSQTSRDPRARQRPNDIQLSKELFDKEGYLIVASEGRGVEGLEDPAPGQPQKHNPFYFQEGNNVGGNAGFPADPGEEPKENNLEQFYGDVPPVNSSGSTQGTVDGQGYSRFSSLRFDADGFVVESPNFI